MPATDTIKVGDLVTFAIRINGNVVPEELNVYSITIEQFINKIPTARITILDGDPSTGKFTASSSASFAPGNEIAIEAGYDCANRTIFKGIITQQSIRINEAIGAALEVECRDAAIKMTVGRKSLSFTAKKDSELISAIVNSYSDVSVKIKPTETTWPQQVQYYATDWDFILSRAEANGLVVSVVNGQVSVAAPDATPKPVTTATYGDNIYEFSADLNSTSQLGSVKASAWDYKNQVVNTGQASNNLGGPGNIASKKLADVIGISDYILQTPVAIEDADLTGWCKAQLIKSEYSKIQGEVTIDGDPSLLPGTYITLSGVGDRFNGDHFISGVVHSISAGNWFCDVSFGMSPLWFMEMPNVIAPPASGLLPGVQGLFQGTVKKIFDDPDGQYRILVNVPLFDPNGEGLWARLSNFYSTSGAGAFFLPEVGDEVILGFLNEDPRYPVILGSLYSNEKLKPFKGLEPDEKNQLKAIVSKSGIYIQFDDVDKILTLTTPMNNKLIFSDVKKQISLEDQNGNSMIMSESGINIKSPKDINITAQQKISISGLQGITIESSAGDVQVTGLNIKENANIQYSAEGGATAQLSSGAELTMKSALIMIN
jgi:Rhs element Vgr protein